MAGNRTGAGDLAGFGMAAGMKVSVLGDALAFSLHRSGRNLESYLKSQCPQLLLKHSFIDVGADGVGIQILINTSCTPGVSPMRSRVS